MLTPLYRRMGPMGMAWGGAFSPLSLSPALWLKADAITGLSDDAYIASWADSSGNNRNATQAGADSLKPKYRTNVLNGQPVVRYDGSDYLDVAITLAQPFTVVLVGATRGNSKPPEIDAGLSDYFFDAQGSASRVTIARNWNATNGNEYAAFSGTALLFTDAAIDDAYVIWTATFAGASGVLRTNGTQRAAGNIGTNNLASLRIGARYTASNFLVGDIAEIIVVASLSDANRAALEQYAAAKYAITIA